MDDEGNGHQLKSVIVTQMRNPSLMNPDLVQCLMETCLDCFDSRSINNIDDDLVVRLLLLHDLRFIITHSLEAIPLMPGALRTTHRAREGCLLGLTGWPARQSGRLRGYRPAPCPAKPAGLGER